MKKTLALIVVCLLLGCDPFGSQDHGPPPPMKSLETPPLSTLKPDSRYKVVINGHTIHVEVVTSAEGRQKGLSGRTSLPKHHGMLFLFEEEQLLAFWMKDTLIPLDILYFDHMGRLVQAYYDVPPCLEDPCLAYPSVFPAKYVLEVNGGTAQHWGLTMGDSMTFTRD